MNSVKRDSLLRDVCTIDSLLKILIYSRAYLFIVVAPLSIGNGKVRGSAVTNPIQNTISVAMLGIGSPDKRLVQSLFFISFFQLRNSEIASLLYCESAQEFTSPEGGKMDQIAGIDPAGCASSSTGLCRLYPATREETTGRALNSAGPHTLVST